MNKDLYDRKVKLPDSLVDHLSKCFNSVKADSNTEGFNRNKELRDSNVLNYQRLKRIKNWFDSFDGSTEDAPFILNGGDRMKTWCNHVLDYWRNTLDIGKKAKSEGGMENEYIKYHTKDEIVVNPQQKHEKGINKYDTSVTEQIKQINDIMKTLI
jgi:hypothetical protein|tara:strand:+ start:18533 stop:18997 length:465 start_codon:yes stop_codon:yes gene_type:complete